MSQLPTREDLDGLSITLEVEEEVLLYIFLGRDGRIERLGNGEPIPEDAEPPELRSGTLNEGERYFETLLDYVTDEMLARPGHYEMPEQQGESCRLRLVFHLPGERVSGLEFEFGSESEGPPSEVNEFVHTALDLTEPWYTGQ